MGKLDKIEDWLDDHTSVITVTIIAVIIALLAIVVAACIIDSGHDDMWNDFADQMNKDTEYYLDKGTVGSCGYIKTIGSDYSTTISVSTSSSGTINYCKVHADDRGIILEWYQKTSSRTYHTSTTYIPYESICYVQANKVV